MVWPGIVTSSKLELIQHKMAQSHPVFHCGIFIVIYFETEGKVLLSHFVEAVTINEFVQQSATLDSRNALKKYQVTYNVIVVVGVDSICGFPFQTYTYLEMTSKTRILLWVDINVAQICCSTYYLFYPFPIFRRFFGKFKVTTEVK